MILTKLPEIVLLSLLFSVVCGTQERDNFGVRLAEFQEVYNPFFRKYFGCPLNARTYEECKPGQGTLDYVLFKHLQEKAVIFQKF